jgi:hypothetical protein
VGLSITGSRLPANSSAAHAVGPALQSCPAACVRPTGPGSVDFNFTHRSDNQEVQRRVEDAGSACNIVSPKNKPDREAVWWG